MKTIIKLALLFACFFSTVIMPSDNLAYMVKSGYIQSFVDKIPTTEISILQEAIHESIKDINTSKKTYYNSSNDILNDLEKCITNEISYLESQIKHNHKYDQKVLRFAAKSLLAASVLTYSTYYFYKNWTVPSRIALDFFKKNSGPRNVTPLNLAQEDPNAKYVIYRALAENGRLELFYISEIAQKEGEKLRIHNSAIEEYNRVIVLPCLASYITTIYSSYQAYSLDPNRNNDSLSKYKQLLKLVILLKEVENPT
ncbi:MAG: hypothetical protein NTU89_04280 [Candidatus Dependentiae bacterium]|nr:hypothetical protein [Candidatus Dependentiae bacterium]